MKKDKLKRIDKIIENILREDELARRDDCYLILEVIRKMYPFEVRKNICTGNDGSKRKRN